MNHDRYTTPQTAADRLAKAICGHTIDQLTAHLAGQDDYLHTAIDEAAMELETIEQTITTAITERRDALHAQLSRLDAVQSALEEGRPIDHRGTGLLDDEGDQAVAEREAAVTGLCDQLRLARQTLAGPR